MHILGTQTSVVKLYYMRILGIQNISNKTLLYAYFMYSIH